MPLAFESLSHGTIAFGFFNIETDLLLLEHYFFFASDFCRLVSGIASEQPDKQDEPHLYILQGFDLPYELIGDLHGAIAGTRLVGFIGEVYKRYPFPSLLADFKQNPEGFETRGEIEKIVRAYGKEIRMPVRPAGDEEIGIGEYRFSRSGFHALIAYVWRGGYPRWKDERRPEYVRDMASAIERSSHPLFEGLTLPD